MQLFRSQGIREAVVTARTRSYRLPWFGRARHTPVQATPPPPSHVKAGIAVNSIALARVPPQWEDVLASYDRAA